MISNEPIYEYIKGKGWIVQPRKILATNGTLAVINIRECPEGVERTGGYQSNPEQMLVDYANGFYAFPYAKGPRKELEYSTYNVIVRLKDLP